MNLMQGTQDPTSYIVYTFLLMVCILTSLQFFRRDGEAESKLPVHVEDPRSVGDVHSVLHLHSLFHIPRPHPEQLVM